MSVSIEKLLQSLARFGIAPGDKVLVAVSGGPDSVCLLYLLKHLPEPYRLVLHVAHLNHQFRPEAESEAYFVAQLSKNWGLPATIVTQPVAAICKESRLSKQAGARTARYAFLTETAKKTGSKWIALGHTADDQAETFLMHMLRGSGLTGLRGIPEKREAGRGAGSIVRPLMYAWRKEILAVLSENKIPFVQDPSNAQPVYLRNKIRHQLIPLLETYNVKIKETLCRETALLEAEDDFMRQAVQAILPTLAVEVKQRSVSFDLSSLTQLHIAMQRRVLRWGIEKVCGELKGIKFKEIERLRALVFPGHQGTQTRLGRGLTAKKQGARFFIQRSLSGKKEGFDDKKQDEYVFPELGDPPFCTEVSLSAWSIRMKISLQAEKKHPFSACKASFDFDKLSPPLSIRSWCRGDRFSPLGMGGRHKKLQDFFVDAKIKKNDRHHIPILSCSEGIMWLIGHRLDARFCATAESRRVLTIEVIKPNETSKI